MIVGWWWEDASTPMTDFGALELKADGPESARTGRSGFTHRGPKTVRQNSTQSRLLLRISRLSDFPEGMTVMEPR